MMFILVLMWKHCLVRIKRYLHTPIEMMSTVLFLFFLYLVRGLFQHDGVIPEERLSDFYLPHTTSNPFLVFYTPVTKNTKALMERVGAKLALPELLDVSDAPETSGYHGVNNLKDIGSFVEKMGESDALVLFQDIEDFLSDRLNYTIRIKSDISQQDTNLIGDGGPYDPFVRLQWAIDHSYLEKRTNAMARTTQNITVEESPLVQTLPWAITMVGMVSFCNALALLLPFVFLMMRAVEERVSGHWEILKMHGVSMWTILLAHMLNVLPTGLFFCLIGCALMKGTDNPMIATTEFVYLLLPHFLYFYSMMLIAMVCNFLVHKTNYASATSALMYLLIEIVNRLCTLFKMPKNARVFTGVIPKVPISWFYSELAELEYQQEGIKPENMMHSHTSSSISVGWSLIWMSMQIAVLSLLVLVFSRVRPGPYGMKKTCCPGIKTKKIVDVTLEQESPLIKNRDPNYFEAPPRFKQAGIEIKNVTKIYHVNKIHALSHVTFDVYKGEILVLLGHNGAGKTTLISIISGILPATAGQVYVNGQDITKGKSTVRKEIGLCTQHDMFIPHLNTFEHVKFFVMLKGQTFRESESATFELLDELKMTEHAYYTIPELSGGVKRRLQLACTLAGDSNVLVLDEPTSGLDVKSRREIWDLLLTLRGDRTIVLTTHYMEEADVLGDRVAVLHEGVLRCHATPMYLKRNIGSGYRLTMLTHGPPNAAVITPIVTLVDGARVRERGINQITYDLPAKYTHQFPIVFKLLEDQQFELGIESIDVGMPTLEEVFLRLCSNWDTNIIDEALPDDAMETYKRLSGCKLKMRQFLVLIKRHFFYLCDSKWLFLVLHVILPVTLMFIMTFLSYKLSTEVTKKPNTTYLDLKHYRVARAGALLRAKGKTSAHEADVMESSDYVDIPLKTSMLTVNGKKNRLSIIELTEIDAKVKFKTRVFNLASADALDLFAEMIAAEKNSSSIQRTSPTQNISIIEDVKGILEETLKNPVELPDSTAVLFWAMFTVILFLFLVAHASSISTKELQTGTRHIYLMAGCSVAMFWGSRMLFFYLFYFFLLFMPTLAALLAFSGSRLIWTPEAMGVLFVVFSCGVCAWLCIVFLLSLFLSGRLTTTIAVCMTFIYGFMVTFAIGTSDTTWNSGNIVRNVMRVFEYTHLPVTFGVAVFKTSDAALANAYCDINKHLCPLVVPINPPFSYIKCCLMDERPVEYYSFDKFAPLPHIISMVLQFILLLALLLSFQKGLLHNRCRSKYKTPPRQFHEPLVLQEDIYVKDTIGKPIKQINDVILVHNMHKKFTFKKLPAVRGISFSVKQGECFGVLGVNGAAKTTCIRMIVGEIAASYGTTFANGHFLQTDRQAYLESLGYCPQFSGLDPFMTGYQNLRTLLTLRGLKEKDLQREITNCLNIAGLQGYKSKKVLGYSGGCLRRLAAGAALSIGAAVTLLDEPTCGVDVTARRRVWASIRRCLQQNRAVIITSHSMDEMEALCARIAVLSRGEVRALGSPAALRAAHAAGHAVVLKLAANPPEEIVHRTGTSPILQLKSEMKRIFNCLIKDEHLTMIHYHINDKMKNSELFSKLEELKAKFEGFVEDYSVSATTLEEVFLSFIQEAQELSEHDRTSSLNVLSGSINF